MIKAIKFNKSGQYFAENVSESTKGYFSIVTPDVSGKRFSHLKDIDKILNPTGIDDFSIDKFFDNLR